MKLSQAQTQWVNDFVSEATQKEEDALSRKKEYLKSLALAVTNLRKAGQDANNVVHEYMAATGDSKKNVIKILQATSAEQHILFDLQES